MEKEYKYHKYTDYFYDKRDNTLVATEVGYYECFSKEQILKLRSFANNYGPINKLCIVETVVEECSKEEYYSNEGFADLDREWLGFENDDEPELEQ